jgi:two-component system phosphate regulon response regulator OmpR
MNAMTEKTQPLILVVHGDLGKLTEIDSILGRSGYLITTCSTAADAKKAVAGNQVDLVLIGPMGDKADEVALTWKVKDLRPTTKVLLLHESTDWADSLAPLDPGADDLLSAPYTRDELLEAVRKLLEKRIAPPSSESDS